MDLRVFFGVCLFVVLLPVFLSVLAFVFFPVCAWRCVIVSGFLLLVSATVSITVLVSVSASLHCPVAASAAVFSFLVFLSFSLLPVRRCTLLLSVVESVLE